MRLPVKDIPTWTLAVAGSIMKTVEVKDSDTFSHCVRVGLAARHLAHAMGLNEYEQYVCEFSGMFHDIGKVGIPDSVLQKPARLTEAEYDLMKRHPELSAEIIKPLTQVDFYKDLIPGILYHHERFDGHGYPVGLTHEEIPLEARILLVVDTFDAMTATRAYRKGLPKEVAYEELRNFAGRQFDPHIVKIFLESHPLWNSSDVQAAAKELQATVLKAA